MESKGKINRLSWRNLNELCTAESVYAETACTGGVASALMVVASMMKEPGRIHTIKPIRKSPPERAGALGINPENRRTGAGEVFFIPYVTVNISSDTKVL